MAILRGALHLLPRCRTAVYRLYDAAGTLLYIGISERPQIRWDEHARTADWWPQVVYRTLVWHGTRLGAAIEESSGFRHEYPVHNRRVSHEVNLGVEAEDWPRREVNAELLERAKLADSHTAEHESWTRHFAAVLDPKRGGSRKGVFSVPSLPLLGRVVVPLDPGGGGPRSAHATLRQKVAGHLGIPLDDVTVSIHESQRGRRPSGQACDATPKPNADVEPDEFAHLSKLVRQIEGRLLEIEDPKERAVQLHKVMTVATAISLEVSDLRGECLTEFHEVDGWSFAKIGEFLGIAPPHAANIVYKHRKRHGVPTTGRLAAK